MSVARSRQLAIQLAISASNDSHSSSKKVQEAMKKTTTKLRSMSVTQRTQVTARGLLHRRLAEVGERKEQDALAAQILQRAAELGVNRKTQAGRKAFVDQVWVNALVCPGRLGITARKSSAVAVLIKDRVCKAYF
eukprot:scaffold216099_cov19-Prasinocladus_malaysianus.AAC.1